jgi:hypothetical protein
MKTAVVVFLLAAAVCSSASAQSSTSDPPRIVPWHQIGSVSVGMLRGAVEYRYGQSSNPPTGNAYASAFYRVPGGQLEVDYKFNRVFQVDTTSPRYKTADGIGVGYVVPLPACKTVNGQCVRIWRGFTLTHEQSQAVWVGHSTYGGRNLIVSLFMGTFVNGNWKHIDTISAVYITVHGK